MSSAGDDDPPGWMDVAARIARDLSTTIDRVLAMRGEEALAWLKRIDRIPAPRVQIIGL